MALTRAQLLSGDIANGAVLTGQPQGVRPGGPGIKFNTNGIIEVDSQTIQGVMKLGQTPAAALAAYNQFDWPTTAPLPGQQLTAITVAGVTTLGWSDADGIPWTAKGQLIVGTGVGTDTLLNAGTNTSFLIADNTTASGLAYTSSSTSAALLPAGNNTTQRPAAPVAGQIRYNNTDNVFEGYGGSPAAWFPFGEGLTAGLGINITGSVVKLEIPIQFGPPAAGTLPAQAIDGSLYWDDNLGVMFIRYNDGSSTQWVQIMPTGGGGGGSTYTGTLPINVTGTVISLNQGLGVATNGNFLISKVPELAAPPAIGTGATQAQLGSTYYDSNLGAMFIYYSNGGAPTWVMV